MRAPRQRAGDDRQEQAFRQQLTDQAGTAGAKRDPNAHFLLACRCSREQEVRNVRAGDQKQERHGAEQHPDVPR